MNDHPEKPDAHLEKLMAAWPRLRQADRHAMANIAEAFSQPPADVMDRLAAASGEPSTLRLVIGLAFAAVRQKRRRITTAKQRSKRR